MMRCGGKDSIGKDRELAYQILYQNFPESKTYGVLLMRLKCLAVPLDNGLPRRLRKSLVDNVPKTKGDVFI
jgi:hypothetical protein